MTKIISDETQQLHSCMLSIWTWSHSFFPASASKKTFDKSTMIQVKATEYEDPLVEKAGVSQSSLVNE